MTITLKNPTPQFPFSPAACHAYLTDNGSGPKLDLAVSVNDVAMRDAIGQSFDGLERPFLELATGERLFLQYQGTVQASGPRPTVDHFTLTVSAPNLSLSGARFGFMTNVDQDPIYVV